MGILDDIEIKLSIKDQETICFHQNNHPPIVGRISIDYLMKRTVLMFDRLLDSDSINSREELEILGTYLFRILFDSQDIEDRFRLLLHKRKKKRISLEFSKDALKLASLPWEFLYIPDSEKYGRGFFLTTNPSVILARYFPMKIEVSQIDDSLRILLIISRPIDLAEISAEPVVKEIQRVGEKRNNWEIHRLDNPTMSDFTKKIYEYKPHVLHFFGHGKYDLNGAYIAFADEKSKEAFWIKETAFSDCFRRHRPSLVYLHTSQAETSDSYEGFRSVGLSLVYSNIPAVVEMRYPVSNRVAIKFARRFYQSVGDGKDIDEAVQEGRWELRQYLDDSENFSSRAFGSPVAYLQYRNRLLTIGTSEKPRINAELKPAEVCPYPDCTGTIRTTSKICIHCRRALIACSNCSRIVAEEIGFCDHCGEKIG